jgi:hypothetical protein
MHRGGGVKLKRGWLIKACASHNDRAKLWRHAVWTNSWRSAGLQKPGIGRIRRVVTKLVDATFRVSFIQLNSSHTQIKQLVA